MTDREKKELIEAEETILQLFFDAYERAMKYTKGNINLSLRMAAMLVSAMVHDQTESKSFQLAGSIFGIRPIWASEIEPFPILVTTKNFPEMKHLGDINKLNGADLEPVTIIAGGSP